MKYEVKVSGSTVNGDGPCAWESSVEASSEGEAVKAGLDRAYADGCGETYAVALDGKDWWVLAVDGLDHPIWKL